MARRARQPIALTKEGERTFPEIEERLRSFATPLSASAPGDWLSHHQEPGQTFNEYLTARPVRRDERYHTIYLCLLGEWVEPYDRLADEVGTFLSFTFDVPVRVHARVPLTEIPTWARRNSHATGTKQFLAPFILDRLLAPTTPPDALGYVALTTRDLWAGDGWNYVFGQADLGRRVAVCSVARNGYPGPEADAYSTCLRRAVLIAAHEVGHILGLLHCTAACCLMNGCNNQDERDRQPLATCPACFRKLCWNLQVEPRPYLLRLEAISRTFAPADAQLFARLAAGLEADTNAGD